MLRDDLVSTLSGLAEAKSSAEGLEKKLAEANSRELEAKARESEAKARESKALDDLRRVQEDNRLWRERADMELRVLDTKFCEAMAKLQPAEERLKDAAHKLEHAEGRADSAEAAARDAAERLFLAEKEVREALDRATAAEAKAQKAVQDFKDSPDFAAECNEAVLDAYVQGFEKCKRRLALRFQLGGLEDVRPGEEDAGTGVGEDVSGPTSVRSVAADLSKVDGPAAEPAEKEPEA